MLVGLRVPETFDQERDSQSGQQGRRQLYAVVAVELQLGQQVAEGDAEEGAGGEAEGDAGDEVLGFGELADAEGNVFTAQVNSNSATVTYGGSSTTSDGVMVIVSLPVFIISIASMLLAL